MNRVALPVAVLIGTAQLLLLPFSTSLWPMPGVEWTFSYRVSIAEIGSFASAGAFNLWGTQIAGIRKLDSLTGWFSLSYQAWGFVLFAATAALVLLLTWRRSRDPGAVLWATFLLAFGFFEVLTKMHARYLFSAIPVLAAATAFRAWMLPYCLAVSALYFVNVWYIWAYQQDIFANLAVTQWVSDFSVLIFVASVIAAMLIALSTRVTVSHRMDLWHLSPATRKWIRTRFPIALLSGAFHRPLSVKAGVGILAIVIALVVGMTLGMAAQAGRDQAGNPFKTATVRAYRSWQDTGVEVVAGQKISMMASGLWMHQMEGELYGPGGSGKIEDKSIILSWAPTGVLLGRIGNSEPFVVGEGGTVSATASGSLQLVMNDWLKRDPQGSRGRVRVIIMVNDP